MLPSVFEEIPPTVLTGLLLGALFALFAAGLFVLGERLFPTETVTGQSTANQSTPSSEDRRRVEIREYLTAIDERYAEGYPIAGHSVAFYLPERDVAVTFDAQAFFRIQTVSETAVVLCEHEMPGSHLGDRLPFDVPDVEMEPTDYEDPIQDAYEALGLPESASNDEITAAYRERVKEVHPDHGGDKESFRQVQEAYATVKEHTR